MAFLGFLSGFEKDHFAVVVNREAVTGDRTFDLFVDQIVLQENIFARDVVVKDVEKIFAVRRAHHAEEFHPFGLDVERLVALVLQEIAAGKNQAVVIRQADRGALNFVHAGRDAEFFVENDVAVLLLLIRQDFQQDNRAENGVKDLRVFQFLQRVVHRLAVNSFAAFGVVFHFDGQIAADGFDEDAVLNRNVRMRAIDEIVARRPRPLEIVLRRIGEFPFRPIIEIFQAAVLADQPFERLDFRAVADMENHQQIRAFAVKRGKPGVFVVGVLIAEIFDELRVVQKVAVHVVETVVFHLIDAEHVRNLRLFFQAEKDVVAENQAAADGDHVAGDAVVLRDDAVGAERLIR